MRKIIATEFYSLDGMISDSSEQMLWVHNTFSEDMGRYEDAVYDASDTLILGRVTFKIFESFWPEALKNPDFPEEEKPMAQKINNARKIVYSKSVNSSGWDKTEFYSEIDPAEVNRIKSEPGKDIIIVGSAQIVRQFIKHNLLDELHLLIHPAVVGKGTPLFDGTSMFDYFKLISAEPLSNGVILAKYQRNNQSNK